MQRRKILIAEDDDGVRSLLEEVLEDAGYKTVLCENGAVAWHRLQAEGADLAVLDIDMPVMNGIDLCRRIRADGRFKSLPLLFLTVRALVADQIAGLDGGADDYLPKPFDPPMLFARIKALERRLLKYPVQFKMKHQKALIC